MYHSYKNCLTIEEHNMHCLNSSSNTISDYFTLTTIANITISKKNFSTNGIIWVKNIFNMIIEEAV